MSTHKAPDSIEQVVKIDLFVDLESPLVATVNSMDELKLTVGPLNMFMDAATTRIVYKMLNAKYHEMAQLSNPTDPLPSLD